MIGSVLATLDFEASSLAMESYPIEVGIAVGRCDGGDPESWSSLIRPTGEWVSVNDWDLEAQAVHGISKELLSAGSSPGGVMNELNARLPGGSVVLCDGGAYDPMWLRKLAVAARIRPTFQLWDIRSAFVPTVEGWIGAPRSSRAIRPSIAQKGTACDCGVPCNLHCIEDADTDWTRFLTSSPRRD